MQLSIITPEKTFFSAEAEMVTIPGAEGEFGVLPGHAPVISLLRPGVIAVEAQGEKKKIAVAEGIAEVVPERCVILAEKAIDCSGLSDAETEAKLAELTGAAA